MKAQSSAEQRSAQKTPPKIANSPSIIIIIDPDSNEFYSAKPGLE